MVKPGDILQRVKFVRDWSFVSYVIALGVTDSGGVVGLSNALQFEHGIKEAYIGVFKPTELTPTGNRIDIGNIENVFEKGRVE